MEFSVLVELDIVTLVNIPRIKSKCFAKFSKRIWLVKQLAQTKHWI